MGVIFDVNRIVEEIYKSTTERERREHRPFGDILKEELDKINSNKEERQ
ncbi:hypothetical protein [uncultured Clostridium sp.]|nr:hypothetical protein [uncultured Clostridium sp.]